jgi:hypothetical protein
VTSVPVCPQVSGSACTICFCSLLRRRTSTRRLPSFSVFGCWECSARVTESLRCHSIPLRLTSCSPMSLDHCYVTRYRYVLQAAKMAAMSLLTCCTACVRGGKPLLRCAYEGKMRTDHCGHRSRTCAHNPHQLHSHTHTHGRTPMHTHTHTCAHTDEHPCTRTRTRAPARWSRRSPSHYATAPGQSSPRVTV